MDSSGLRPASLGVDVVVRFDVSGERADECRRQLEGALDLLTRQPGCESGSLAQCLDESDVVQLTTRWSQVGDWRRALSRPEVKMDLTPLLVRCRTEPSAFDVVREFRIDHGSRVDRSGSSALAADADAAAPGSAAADHVDSAWQT